MGDQRVVVTGAGSGVGNAIVKSLRLAASPPFIIATDISELNAGLYRADHGLIWPPVENAGALCAIIASLQDLAADAVLIGSEYELEFFAVHKQEIEEKTGACVVVSAPEIIRIANDKWRTCEFLAENDLPRPQTTLPGSVDEAIADATAIGWPVILKPRRGTSGRGVHRVSNEDDMRSLFVEESGQIVQELLGKGGGMLNDEYTCSIFRLSDGTLLGPFTARRSLRGGDSWVVEVDRFETLHPLILAIGNAMPAMGPLNVQMIETEAGPVPFEINARYSGTTAIRAHFGFNEPLMALQHFVSGEALETPKYRKGIALRYTEEVFVDDYNVVDLAAPLPTGKVNRWF